MIMTIIKKVKLPRAQKKVLMAHKKVFELQNNYLALSHKITD